MNGRKRRKKKTTAQKVGTIFFTGLIVFLTVVADLCGILIGKVSDFCKTHILAMAVVAGVSLVSVAVAFGMWQSQRINAQKVYVGDLLVGIIGDLNITADEIYEKALEKLKTDEGTEIEVAEKVTAEKVHSKDKAEDLEYVIGKVYNKFTYKVMGTVIYIDGEATVTLKTREDAGAVLSEIKDKYLQEGLNIVETTFVEKVETNDKFVDKSLISSKDKALFVLLSEKTENVPYIVQKGDSVWLIAANAGIIEEEIYKINPNLNEDPTKLKVGQTLYIPRSVPMLSVRTRERTEVTEGNSIVTIDIIRENGFETRRNMVSSTPTAENAE